MHSVLIICSLGTALNAYSIIMCYVIVLHCLKTVPNACGIHVIMYTCSSKHTNG